MTSTRRSSIIAARTQTILLASALSLWSMPALAQARPERLSDKDAVKKDVELLIKQADTVKSRTTEGKPATSEGRQLVEQVAKLQTCVDAHPIPTMTNWQAVQTSRAQTSAGLRPDAVTGAAQP